MCSTVSFILLWWSVGSPAEPRTDYGPAIEELRGLIPREIARLDVPALSIALVDGQRIVWEAGFGMQDPARGIPATESTVYRPASISKLLTAAAVMQLHEKGVLDVDAPITDYLPALVFKDPFDSKEPITLRRLLAHRAGILRESPVGNYFDDTDPGVEATVKSIIGTDLVHPVGAVTKYSNLGATVAGYIIEKVTNTPFPRYMTREFFEPLKMHSSSFLREGARIERHLARGFMFGFDGRRFPAPYLNLGTLPAGNMYSTVGDLARFMMMVLAGGAADGGRLLREDTVERMFTIQFPAKGVSADFGLGFFVGRRGARRAVSHAGAVYGFASLLTCLPEEKLGVIVMNTADCAGGINRKITDRAFELLLHCKYGEPLSTPPAVIPLDGIDLAAYAGAYRGNNRTARVFVADGGLAMNTTGVDVRLSALSPDRWVADGRLAYGTDVAFVRGEDGAITAMRAGGALYVRVPGYRRDDTVPERWRDLVGLYGWPHNLMKIFVRDGQLVCLVEWFFEYPMTETGARTFLFPDYGLYSNEKLVFEADADGAIRGAVMAHVFFKRWNGAH